MHSANNLQAKNEKAGAVVPAFVFIFKEFIPSPIFLRRFYYHN